MKKLSFILIVFMLFINVYAIGYGDVNNDGTITSQDYILVRRHIMGITTLNADQLKTADMNSDNNINTQDYILIKKKIMSGETTPQPIVTATPTPTPSPTPTPIPTPVIKYTVTLIGSNQIQTGFEGGDVVIEGGEVSEHRSVKSLYKLKTNTEYVVSFDYVTTGGENTFDVDLYPDTLPQVNLKATATSQHYDWKFSSDNVDITNCYLRFFDDIRSKKEKDITISNITMGDVKYLEYNAGSTLSDLPTPSKSGHKFDGWYTSPTGGEMVTTSTQVNGNMTLYARWSKYYKHVFIIGVDGLGAALTKVSSPNFDKIFNDYAFRHDAKTEYKTISAQNWGSILTGVAYDKHKYTNDSISDNKKTSDSKYLSVFYYVKRVIPKAKLVSIVNWNPINHGIVENDIGVKLIHGDSDKEVTDKIIDYLDTKGAPTLMFVQFDEVDHTAHSEGGFSDEYYDAVTKADKRIGKIFNKIKSIEALDSSLFIVVADHGETDDGHGGHTKEESSAVVAVRGYTVNKVELPEDTQNRDVAAIVLYALGIDIPSHFTAKVPSNLFNK